MNSSLQGFLCIILLQAANVALAQENPSLSISATITENHVPMAKSVIYIDTTATRFRPIVSPTGGDWSSGTSRFVVMAFTENKSRSLSIDSELQGVTESEELELVESVVEAPFGRDVRLYKSKKSDHSGFTIYFSRRDDRIVMSSSDALTDKEINDITLALAIKNPVEVAPNEKFDLVHRPLETIGLIYGGVNPMFGPYYHTPDTLASVYVTDDPLGFSTLLDSSDDDILESMPELAVTSISRYGTKGDRYLSIRDIPEGNMFKYLGIYEKEGHELLFLVEGEPSAQLQAGLLEILKTIKLK